MTSHEARLHVSAEQQLLSATDWTRAHPDLSVRRIPALAAPPPSVTTAASHVLALVSRRSRGYIDIYGPFSVVAARFTPSPKSRQAPRTLPGAKSLPSTAAASSTGADSAATPPYSHPRGPGPIDANVQKLSLRPKFKFTEERKPSDQKQLTT
jgi:hypothetical protein